MSGGDRTLVRVAYLDDDALRWLLRCATRRLAELDADPSRNPVAFDRVQRARNQLRDAAPDGNRVR